MTALPLVIAALVAATVIGAVIGALLPPPFDQIPPEGTAI